MCPQLGSLLDPSTKQQLNATARRSPQRSRSTTLSAAPGRRAHVARAQLFTMCLTGPDGRYVGQLAFDKDAVRVADKQTKRKRNLIPLRPATQQLVQLMFDLFVELDHEQHNQWRVSVGWGPILGRVAAVIDVAQDQAATIPAAGPNVTSTVFWQAADFFREAIKSTAHSA